MPTPTTERTRERLLMQLKMRGAQTAQQLAARLGITPMAVRQHLYALNHAGEVDFEDFGGKVGRPSRHWSLTKETQSRFPDTHADLTLRLIDSVRSTLGESALQSLIAHQRDATEANYRQHLKKANKLPERVRILARLRDEEGYMASSEHQADGSYLLVENHCPICAAAESCQGFCDAEQELLQRCIGNNATVTREEHLLAGARRCAYRIRPI